jgi:hypothetical protein
MTLPHDELVFGYWPARQMRGDIPSPVRRPDQYAGSDTLNIACTQTGLPGVQQARLIEEWCAVLPTLPVKTLVFSSKVPQRLFDAACRVSQLEALHVKWSSIESLDAICSLASLRSLFLGSSPGIACLAPISALSGLAHLFVENVQDPVDLSFVEQLRELLEFGLAAPRGRKLRVRTLEPLGSLTQVQLLWLVSLQVQQGDLKPLYGLQHLASLRTTMKASSTELRELCAAVPTLKYLQSVG